MKVLFISNELIGSAVVHRLLREGHDVKLYIGHPDRKNCFDGFVEKVSDWRTELNWVDKDGLIIFDDVVFKGAENKLRAQGFSVFGGDLNGDRLELDRQFFQDKLREHGLPVLPSYEFTHAVEAIDFITKHPGKWVLKQSSHIGMLNYVGQREDASDVLDMLESYKDLKITNIQIQQRVDGVEVGIGRHFNGKKWIGPMKVNCEHKPLCNGNIGPLTAEMGTVVWFEDNDRLPLFQNTLAKIESYLKMIEYKGDIDINCIANQDGVWPLEATMRFGTPSTELHIELYDTNWGEMLKAIADGEDYSPGFSKEFGVVVSIALPPFPYAPETFSANSEIITCTGTSIFLNDDISPAEMKSIHFEEVSKTTLANGKERYYIAGKHGYAMYITGKGTDVRAAQKSVYNLIKKIHIPKMFYRTDIGENFAVSDHAQLKQWGII